MTRSVAAGAGRGTAWGAGGGRMASSSWWWVGALVGSWVPWCLWVSTPPNLLEFLFFWWLLKKNGKFRFFLWLWWQHGFFCWLISINQHMDDALPSRRPRGSGPALWVFCRISMDFQSQDMTTSIIIIINPSQTHPPPPAANGDSWANWAFTLAAHSSASKATSAWGWDYRCMGKIMGLTPKGWYEHIRTNNPSYLREHIERFRNLSRRLHQLQSKQHCHWYTCSLEYHTTIMSYKSQLKM